MKGSKSKKVMAAVMLGLSLVLAIGVATVFRPCAAHEDGSWMNCHYAGRNVMWVGIALCVFSLLHLLDAPKPVRLALDAIQIILAALALLIPGHIMHLCMMAEMRCNAIMKPSVSILAVLIAAVSAIDGILSLRAER